MSRIIESAEELDTLPIGSVVLSDAYRHHENEMQISFQRWFGGAWHRGGRSADTHPDNFLPATVIHVPEARHVIPEAAITAAWIELYGIKFVEGVDKAGMRRALEAAAPHMLGQHVRTCDISGPNCEAIRDPSMKCTMMVCGPCGEPWPCPTIAALD